MNRREFVLAALAASASPRLFAQQQANPVPPLPAPEPWTLGLTPKTPLPAVQSAEAVAETELRFFTPTQMRTLIRLCDLLLPPIGDKPGALAADTPLFLDFFVAASPTERRDLYSNGLDTLETGAEHHSARPFADLDDRQADQLIRPWLRTWMSDHPPTEPHAAFLNIAHHDIRTATVASRAWSEAAARGAQEHTPVDLYWSPIDPDLHPSAAPVCNPATSSPPPGPTPPPH